MRSLGRWDEDSFPVGCPDGRSTTELPALDKVLRVDSLCLALRGKLQHEAHGGCSVLCRGWLTLSQEYMLLPRI